MKQPRAFCESERAWLRQTIEQLVRLESPTPDKGALDRCGAEIGRLLAAVGGRVREVPHHERWNHLVAEFGDGPRPVLLLGHFDTVWPVGSLSEMPIVERGGRLFGPGVLDMKGGIGIALLAIRALGVASPCRRPHG